MKKLFAIPALFLLTFSAQAQKTMISASVENNVFVDARSDLGDLHWGSNISQRIVVSYGKSVIPNGFVTVGLGFEVLGVDVFDGPTSRLYSFNSRRLLLPVAFRYAIPMTDKLNISGQLGGQMGLFVNGSGALINIDDRTYAERTAGLYNKVAGDVNLAIGIDRKLNAHNIISIAPNANYYMTNLLKDGHQLKPISLGVKVGYIHLF